MLRRVIVTSKLFERVRKLSGGSCGGSGVERLRSVEISFSLIESWRLRDQMWTFLPNDLIISWIEWWWWPFELNFSFELLDEAVGDPPVPLSTLLCEMLEFKALMKLELSKRLRGDSEFLNSEFRWASDEIEILSWQLFWYVPVCVKYWWSVLYS